MTEEAAARLLPAAQDYPFFLQVLGSAAWDAARSGGPIDEAAADGALREAIPEIERFYGERLQEAAERGVGIALGPVARLFAARSGFASDREVDAALQAAAVDLEEDMEGLRIVLRDLGILWEPEPGRWEMGIPSFADHVVRRLDGGTATVPGSAPAARRR